MITIHKAKTEEVLEIKKLLKETWTSTYADLYSPEAIETVTSKWHAPEFLKQQIEDKDGFFLVAKDGDNIVGMGNAILTHNGEVINLQRLHISPNNQGQGIGTMLVQKILTAFPTAKKADLEVEKQNHKAQAFYKKHGFENVGETVFEVQNIKLDCLVMEKMLE